MVLLIISIILFVTLLVLELKSVFLPKGLAGTLFFLAAISFFVALVIPFGYEQPELVETQPLYPINFALHETEATEDCYVAVQIGRKEKVYFCIEGESLNLLSDGDREYRIKSLSEGVRIVLEDIDEPVIETYNVRPVRTAFNMALGLDVTEYIIRVPEAMVRNISAQE
jgi:hypothetical protein